MTGTAVLSVLASARAKSIESGRIQVLDAPIPLSVLDTPVLLIDLAAFERNLDTMAKRLAEKGLGLRPHAKTHKSAIIARKQLERGAVGICCAKVSEAEALAKADISGFLITSPITTPEKTERFVQLAQTCPESMIVVDSVLGVDMLSQAALAAKVDVSVLIDLDVGTQRTGVPCGDKAVAFAQYVAGKAGLRIKGVQAYAGHLMHVKGWETRRQRSLEAMQSAVETRAAIEAAGIPCPIFTGGGTGTFDIDVDVPGMTDLQCGSYPFMDVQYRVIGGQASETLDTFEPALFVWSTAISQPTEGKITFDAGYKALSNENIAPQLTEFPTMRYDWGGDEHGIVHFGDNTAALKLGEKARIFIAHCDPTVNLFDVYHVVRDGAVVEIWPIHARGCVQ